MIERVGADAARHDGSGIHNRSPCSARGVPCGAGVALGNGALWVVVLSALVSAADYFRRFSKPTAQVTHIEEARQRRSSRRAG